MVQVLEGELLLRHQGRAAAHEARGCLKMTFFAQIDRAWLQFLCRFPRHILNNRHLTHMNSLRRTLILFLHLRRFLQRPMMPFGIRVGLLPASIEVAPAHYLNLIKADRREHPRVLAVTIALLALEHEYAILAVVSFLLDV